MIFAMLKYNYCFDSWICKFTVLKNRKIVNHNSIFSFIKMLNYTYLPPSLVNRIISFSGWMLICDFLVTSSNLGMSNM